MNYQLLSRIITLGLILGNVSACTKNTESTPPSTPQYSKLWGQRGEKWDPLGRLPDFSYAGYHAGHAAIPTPPVTVNVLDFGAIPNDELDDSASFLRAIDSIPSGVILIPKGRYILTQFINIEKSGIILRGEGEDEAGTILYMPKSATEISNKEDRGFATGGKGQIISFKGNRTSEVISQITQDAQRGTHTIHVADASKIKKGQKVLLQVTDNKLGGEFWKHLHNNALSNWKDLISWSGASGKWPFIVESVKGNTVTLLEPLRFDLKAPWKATLLSPNNISECGIENLRMEFPLVEPAAHLEEPGYNGIFFISATDCWARNITIVNADNAITSMYETARITIDQITLTGRRGHHGISLSGASNCLISGLIDNCNEPWTHTITMDHRSCGNVHKGSSGSNIISLDFHRHIPFENLHTDIQAQWNFNSSGNPKAGPHAGARNTYWGLSGKSVEPANPNGQGNRDFLYRHWGKIQTTLVTDLAIPELFSDDEEWYEHLPDLQPRDLHQAQLDRRLQKK